MRHLSVALIFWLTIWTVPRCETSWLTRGLIAVWGVKLCQQLIKRKDQNDSIQ